MTEISAAEIGTTHDCRVPGCTGVAASNRGMYAYLCDGHAEEKKRGLIGNVATVKNGHRKDQTFAQRLGSLAALAKAVDKARDKATRLTEQALAAKNEADRVEREFREAMRDLGVPE